MIDLKDILKPKRYRGLWKGKGEENYINFDIVSADGTKVKIDNIFPFEIKEIMERGDKIQCFANTQEGFVITTFEVEDVNTPMTLNLLNFTYDKRKAVRLNLGENLNVKVLLHKDNRVYEGKLRDISLAGMSAIFPAIPIGIKAGDIEMFEFEYDMMGGVVSAEIKRVIKDKNGYTVAVEFIKEDPEEVELIHNFVSNAYLSIFKT